jgi:hypothetical protein
VLSLRLLAAVVAARLCGMEKKLLDLMAEYVNYESEEATLSQFGHKMARTRDEIAAEYGRTLKQFLAS